MSYVPDFEYFSEFLFDSMDTKILHLPRSSTHECIFQLIYYIPSPVTLLRIEVLLTYLLCFFYGFPKA